MNEDISNIIRRDMDKLDEKGFVFIDENNKPYWCCIYEGSPWFMWWHPDKMWVTLRQVNQTEVWGAYNYKIPDDHAEIYHKQHDKNQLQL